MRHRCINNPQAIPALLTARWEAATITHGDAFYDRSEPIRLDTKLPTTCRSNSARVQCRHLTRRIFHISATLPSQFSHIYCTVYIYFPRCTVYSIHIFLHLVVLQYHILYITCILSIPDSCTVLHRFITPTCTKQIPKVVSASWRKEFFQFLASLAFLHQDNWTNRMMSS